MANQQQPIQIPSYTPPQAQFQPPTDLVNGYFNRQQNAQQYAGNSAVELGKTANELRQQALQNYIALQGAKAATFGQGGPALYQQLYGQNNQPSSGPSFTMPGTPTQVPSGSGGGSMGPSSVPSSSTMGAPPPGNQIPQVGGMSPSNGAETPTSSAQTLSSNKQTSTQSGQPLMNQQSGLPQTIHDSASGVYSQMPDFSGHLAKIKSLQNQMDQSNSLYGASTYGQKNQQMLSSQMAAEKAAMDAEQAPTQFAKTQQDLANAQASVPMEVGKSSADAQKTYNTQDEKIQAGFSALNDYYKALQAVPRKEKGAGVGIFTSKAGSPAGNMAPQLVAANKARTAAITTLATALLPESARTNPQAVQEIANSLASVGDDPKVISASFSDLYNKLATVHQLNTSGSQSVAGATGGNIIPSKIPKLNFNAAQGQSTAISSKAQYDALPNGTPFVWNGKQHIKGKY